jgi:pimeloyl-ACP methyl ester carboxylesterase
VSEEFCTVGDIRLCYESLGDPADPAVLLVMGLGTQMIAWHDDFCADLVRRGFRVVRFDNRDCGRSTILRHVPPPSSSALLTRRRLRAAYTLDHMADDAAGLLDALEIDRVHVVGASMGGMIAQAMVIRHPARVRSLVSIMSTTGSRRVGQPAWRVYPVLLRRAPAEREAYVELAVHVFGLIGSPGFPRDEDELRRLAGRSYDRGVHSAGSARQLAAIVASADRTAALRSVRVPTLVVHGLADPLVNPSGGRATARAIPGARLLEVPGMGHALPRGAWPRIVDGIADTAGRADAPEGAPTGA